MLSILCQLQKQCISKAVIVAEYQAAFQAVCLFTLPFHFHENFTDHKMKHHISSKDVELLSVKEKRGNMKPHFQNLARFKVEGHP